MNVRYKKSIEKLKGRKIQYTVHTCMFGWLGKKEAEKRCLWLCMWIREREREQRSRVAISKGKDTPRICMPFQ
jgi:hypothetical protein